MWIAAVLIFVCFLIALSLSIAGWFEQFTSAQLFGMGSILSAGGFATLYAISHAFRGFLKARSLKALTLGQTMRFYGILALFKAYQHVFRRGFRDSDWSVGRLFCDLIVLRSKTPRRQGRAGHIRLRLVACPRSVRARDFRRACDPDFSGHRGARTRWHYQPADDPVPNQSGAGVHRADGFDISSARAGGRLGKSSTPGVEIVSSGTHECCSGRAGNDLNETRLCFRGCVRTAPDALKQVLER